MTFVTISEFRNKIKSYTDRVEADQDPLVVTRSDSPAVVVIPLAVYESMKETDYLLSSPANAVHLRKSINEISKSKTVKFDIQ